MKKLLLLPLLFTLGCEVTPVMTKKADDNAAVDVSVIATFDGIRLYRVYTGDRTVYVAARPDGHIDTNWMRPVGKTHVPEDVTTLR
jgi:hypothetical protein